MAIGGEATRLLLRISADASKAIAEFKKLSGAVSSEVAQISRASKTSGDAGEGMGTSFLGAAKGVYAIGAAAVGAAVGLVAFAKMATQTAADLHDLSKQTGFAVETLSALKIAADLSGSSIGSIGTALGIFEKNMIAAASGNKKMSAAFQALNIDTKDNELALRQAFAALSAMESGAGQTAAAMTLFGRSGKDVLGVIKETNGDLDKAIDKYRDLAILITTEDAKAADQFHDSLSMVGKQLAAVGLEIGKALIPVMTILAGVCDMVTTAFKGWGLAIDWVKQKLGGGWIEKAMGQVMAFHPGIAAGSAVSNVMGALRTGTPAPSLTGGGGGGGRKAKAGISEEGRIELDNLKEITRGITGAARETREALDREFALGRMSRAEFFQQAQADVDKEYRIRVFALANEAAAAQAHIKDQSDLNKKLADLEREKNEAKKARNKERQALSDEANEAEIAAQIEYLKQADAAQKSYEDRSLEAAERALEHQAITEREFEELRFQQRRDQLDRRIELLTVERSAYGEFAEEYIAYTQRIIQAENDRIHNDEDIARRRAQMAAAEFDKQLVRARDEKNTGGGITLPGSDEFNRMMEGLMDRVKPPIMNTITLMGEMKNAAVDAFGAITQGFGDMIYAFLMGEKFSAKAFMAMAKAAIASVAATAAVRALFELGAGLAALFLNPAEAAAHFAAAKVFASVALVAGLASLAIPGGGATANSSPVASNASPSRTGSAQEIKPIDRNRTAGEIRVSVNVTRDSGSIVDAFVEDFGRNGRTRRVIGNDGQLATA